MTTRTLPPPEEIVRRYERDGIDAHPYFQMLAREPPNLHRMWLLIANGRESIVRHFSRRLAGVVARVTDERLRCMLAKQLNDELGNGDYTKAHRLLFEQLLSGLDPWRPAEVTEATLAPGRELSRRLEEIYSDPDGYVGVGASMVIEIYGKQIDHRVGREMRRANKLTPDALTWLTIHEELEIDHAEESMVMAKLVPPEGAPLEATWRGADGIGAAFKDFFDAMLMLKAEPQTILEPAPGLV